MSSTPHQSNLGQFASEMASLSQVMDLYDELGGDGNPVLRDFINVSRRWVRTEDAAVREAPFAESRKQPCRLYLFRDLLVVAALGGSKGAAPKVVHYLNLQQCSVKELSKEDGGESGLVCTVVTRLRMNKDGSLANNNHEGRIVTRIEKFEVWFPKKEVRDDVVDEIHTFLDDLEHEEEMNTREPSSSGGGDTAEDASGMKKQRSWAAKRNTLKHARKSNLSQGGESDSGQSVSEASGGLSLADLEARYAINFKTPTINTDEDSPERVEFEISFGEGPMGFSVGSGKGVGVIVGRLAPGSFAEMAGVCIGDRVLWLGHDVEGIDVGLDTTWQECVDKIKALPRPLSIRFERTAARQVDPDRHAAASGEGGGGAAAAAAASSSPAPSTTPSSDGGVGSGEGHHHHSGDSTKRRAWANRRAQRAASHGGGMVNLSELEKVYKESSATSTKDVNVLLGLFDKVEAANPKEKAAALVLKEIFTTERDYVSDLRALVGEYIIPLRRAVRRGKCKDIEGASKFCEHNLIRSTCNRMSHEAHPILDTESMKAIFCNTETILTVNSELLTTLQKGLAEVSTNKKQPNLGDLAGVFAPAFLKITPFFKMYSQYCHNYYQATDRLSMVRSMNQELHQFLTQKEDKSTHVTLSSLLIKPVQRICKYPLLFTTLLKEMSASGETKHLAELKKAGDAVEAIAESVNKAVGESDTMEHMLHVFEELGGEKGAPGLMAAHRRFVRTDDVTFVDTGDKSGEHHRVLYLFNDILVVAKTMEKSNSSGTLHKGLSLKKLSKSLTGSRKSMSDTLHSGHFGIAKMEHSFDVEQMTVTPVEDAKGARFGISIKYVSVHVDEKKKRGTLTRKATAGSQKIVTSIEKYEVWMAAKADRDSLFADISKQIEVQDALTQGHKKAEVEVGAPKKQHSWARGGHKDSNVGSLQELADKYKSGKASPAIGGGG